MSLFDLGMKFASSKSNDGGPGGLDIFNIAKPPTEMTSADFSKGVSDPVPSVPTTGDFSFASLQTKAGELVDSTVKMGKDVVDSITGFINGDKSGAVETLKNGMLPATNKEVSQTNTNPAGESDSSKFFVTLKSQVSGDTVTFFVTPEISETRSASYEEVGIVHHPGQILRYKSSSPRDWGVTVKLITRTSNEAAQNLVNLNILRSWTMPYYGEGTARVSPDKLGAPPDVLIFSAYGDKMIPPHPVVLTNFQTTFPNDIDYLPTSPDSNGMVVPFPTLLTIVLSLKEAWSPKEFSQFNLADYKNGDLSAAFGSTLATQLASQGIGNNAVAESPNVSALMAGVPATTDEPVVVAANDLRDTGFI